MTDALWTFNHLRNGPRRPCREISKALPEVPIFNDESIADQQIDRLIMIPSEAPFAKESVRAAVAHAIATAREVIWVKDDYKHRLPSIHSMATTPFRACARVRHAAGRSPIQCWSTCDLPGEWYVNWNALNVSADALPEQHGDGVIYYGYRRPYREIYFERYFREPQCPVYISYADGGKSSLLFSRYTHENVKHLSPMRELHDLLRCFGVGLYIEDTKSHVEFHSPAGRFYEQMTTIGCVAFQPEALWTMKRGGYTIYDNWVASDSAGLASLYERRDDVRRQQETLLAQALEESQRVAAQVREMWEAL